jgi:hypothetical protein
VPFVLEAIARIHMAKDQYEAAKVALQNLLTLPGARQLARGWLARLEGPGGLDLDPELKRLRQFRRLRDEPVKDQLFDQILLDMIAEHPNNRVAVDYLMGYYLLTRQDEKIAANLDMLLAAGYTFLPRHYHQALLIYADRTRQPVQVRGLAMDSSVIDEFSRFNSVARSVKADRAGLARHLASQFGDTYMYYYLFGLSGVR